MRDEFIDDVVPKDIRYQLARMAGCLGYNHISAKIINCNFRGKQEFLKRLVQSILRKTAAERRWQKLQNEIGEIHVQQLSSDYITLQNYVRSSKLL